jgi:hypothetical protein
MRANSHERDELLEDELRRVLGLQAQAAPMPLGVLEIPERWADQPRRLRLAPIGRGVAIAAAVTLVVALAAYLPRIEGLGAGMFRAPLTAAGAAAFVGVPAEQVVETRDGAVLLRVVPGPQPQAQVILVTQTDAGLESSLHAQVPVPLGVLDAGSSLIWSEQLSCAPERGLRQPNMLFGASNPSPTRMTINVPAQGTWHDRLFLFVLEDADLTGHEVLLETGTGSSDRRSGLLFDRGDACTGEPPSGH